MKKPILSLFSILFISTTVFVSVHHNFGEASPTNDVALAFFENNLEAYADEHDPNNSWFKDLVPDAVYANVEVTEGGVWFIAGQVPIGLTVSYTLENEFVGTMYSCEFFALATCDQNEVGFCPAF
ncbi:MAG: hypothetical protein WDZ29_06135 [Balneolaceae bacterium]